MKRQISVPGDLFINMDYFHYVVQYEGNIIEEVSKVPGYYVTIINNKYAIVSVKGEVELNVEGPKFSSIVYVRTPEMYTLEQISPIQASKASFLQVGSPLNLTGKGVNIAIIDTGIDYLSEEFMESNGETRIEAIWDQTIVQKENAKGIAVPFGAVFFKDEIQNAIQASREGGSPYDIVPTKDEIGHGTNMAGIIGATGKNPMFKGVAPECNFIIIKLIENFSYKNKFNIDIPVYDIVSIFVALEFLGRYSLDNYKPLVIYFPLGTNLGNHKGNGILEQLIESICKRSSIAMVSGTGNQRETSTHTSGIITEVGAISTIELDVSLYEKNLIMEIWVDSPNIMSLDIVSPSGENSGVMSVMINITASYTFIFEKTSLKVNYFTPEETSGDELIRIRFYNIQPGIWKIKLIGNHILDGKYNAWISQLGITKGTNFPLADPYGTVTNPNGTDYVITVAAYNQNNNNILNYSGMAFIEEYLNKIDVAAGGVNALTVAPNNKTTIANGTSVAAAVVTGTCAMLFQWGIVDGNNPYMFTQTIKAYLTRGTAKRSGDIYPNQQWGYGILDVLSMFENMI